MPDLYAGVYHAVGSDSKHSIADSCGKSASLFEIARQDKFPYDVGDDPAFLSARRYGGRLTWGVCRPDVRTAIRPEDWMVFFAAERSEQSDVTHYRFVAALTVENKVRQTEVFDSPAMRVYRHYLNLLIRRKGSGWEHHEPGLPAQSKGHTAWLWRMSNRKTFTREELVAAGARHRPGQSLLVRGIMPIAANYVIFGKAGIVAVNPPFVASYRKGHRTEKWNPDRCSRQIREIVFDGSSRTLRTTNRQQPHRHFRREITDVSWLNDLKAALGNNWRRPI